MKTLGRHNAAFLLRAAMPVLLLVGGIAVLWRFPPAAYSFYPQCVIHTAFGILCPGCGGTRALAQLLHGHLHEALRLNALTTLLVPVATVYAGYAYLLWLHRRPLWAVPVPAVYATLAAAVLFAIVRNL
jgi:hypothetical protein